jgi:hypothetical protein
MIIANALAFKFGIPNYRSSLKLVLPALDESLCQMTTVADAWALKASVSAVTCG